MEQIVSYTPLHSTRLSNTSISYICSSFARFFIYALPISLAAPAVLAITCFHVIC